MLGLFRVIQLKVADVYSFHSVGYNFETTPPDVGELLRRGCHHHRWRKSLEKIQVLN